MEKWRLIFVDDESGILSTMRRIMWRKREQWQVDFASSGLDGLELLRQFSPHVVISDMRMPGMEGAEFLAQVAQSHPATVRIIMTGNSSVETFIKVVGPVHMVLYKPVEPDHFIELIDRLAYLFSMPISLQARHFLGSVTSLPLVPTLHHQLMKALNDPGCTFDKISEIIAMDPALTAKILHLINSALFGLTRKVVRLEDAIRLLGMDIIRSLALGTTFFSRFDGMVAGKTVESMAYQSLQVARCAKWIAGRLTNDPQVRDEAFLAGLLHRLGYLVVLAQQAEERTDESDAIPLEKDEQIQGWMGAFLLGLWGLSSSIMGVMAFYLRPQSAPRPDCPVLLAVHLAHAHCRRTLPEEQVLSKIGGSETWVGWQKELQKFLLYGEKNHG
ncbi:MAG: HDOD domain-containing protein [Magnetococcales bacterium]|nr:HDOD domain-containing protein [Magnetococcales bacterium]NGZ27143.1 HDOD domain-containing protein [Magnetococcales bacterium]